MFQQKQSIQSHRSSPSAQTHPVDPRSEERKRLICRFLTRFLNPFRSENLESIPVVGGDLDRWREVFYSFVARKSCLVMGVCSNQGALLSSSEML